MPKIEDVEQLCLSLTELGNEIPTLAKWGEKLDRFSLLQRRPVNASLKRTKEALQSTGDGASSRGDDTDRLSRILDSFAAGELKLDSLSATPSGKQPTTTATPPVAQPTEQVASDGAEVPQAEETPDVIEADYNEELLSNALSKLSSRLRNDIVKILENPLIDAEMISDLIDDLILNQPTRQIQKQVQKINTQYALTEKRESGLRAKATRYLESESALGLSLRALLISTLIAMVLFGAWRFLYRPISSHILYRSALNAISDDRFLVGEEVFDRARVEQRFRYQLFGIAEAYDEAQALEFADKYYNQYIEEYPDDIQRFLTYIRFISSELGDDERAIQLATMKFEAGEEHRDLLRVLGDLHLERGDRSRRRTRGDYEDARYYYAYLIDKYGMDRDSLTNMLRYFMRVQNESGVSAITDTFEAEEYQQVRPVAVSELLEYLLDSGREEQAYDILRNLDLAETKYAGIHFQAARYFRQVDNTLAADESLRNTVSIFRKHAPTTRSEEEIFIRLQGELAAQAAANGESEEALELYNRAIAYFEPLLESDVLVPRRFFGALYAGRGDVYYANDNYELALENYALARRQLYHSPDLEYHVGSIYYRALEYRQAVLFFERIKGYEEHYPISVEDKNVLYALGNAFFLLDGYSTALGYYRELMIILERELNPSLLVIDESNIFYRDIIEMLIATYNNIGVSYAYLHQVQSNQDYLEKGIFYLQKANEQYDEYRRLSTASLPPLTRSLSYRNSFAQLHNDTEQLDIYRTLPRNLGSPFVSATESGLAGASTPFDPRVRHIESP